MELLPVLRDASIQGGEDMRRDYGELVSDLRIYANDGTDELRSRAADAIEQLVGISDKLTRWIPTTERLPEDGGYYIVYFTDSRRKMVGFAQWQKRSKCWALTGPRAYWKVTHWMPLPAPPEDADAV